MRQNVTEAFFPEDLTVEEFKARGGSEQEHAWRSRTFAEDLYRIRNESIDPDKTVYSRKEVLEAIDYALANVQYLLGGDGPHLAKYQLHTYSGFLNDRNSKTEVVTITRPCHVDPEDYYELVNT